MLPHEIGVVSDEPTVLHSAGQSEAQIHPDVVVQGAVICRGVRAEWAIPMRHLPLYDPAFVDKGTTLFNLSHGSWADNIIQPDVPVSSIVRVAGVNNLALDTTEDINNILAVNQSGFGALLWDSHHSCTVSFKSICRSGVNPEKVLRIRRGAMQVYYHNQ